jgi:hypothetical protein
MSKPRPAILIAADEAIAACWAAVDAISGEHPFDADSGHHGDAEEDSRPRPALRSRRRQPLERQQ